MTIKQVAPFSPIYFDICGYCNGSCLYCATGRRKNHYNAIRSSMPLGQFKDIVEHLFSEKLIFRENTIHLYNFGESLLHPKINDILLCLKDYGLRVALSSNLIYMPEFDKIAFQAITHFRLSISGFSQESYGRIHGASLECVLANAVRLSSFRDKYNPRLQLEVAWFDYKFNMSEVNKARNFFTKKGFAFIETRPYFNDATQCIEYDLNTMPLSLRKRADEEMWTEEIVAGWRRCSSTQKEYTCPALSYLVISSTGRLLLCCGLPVDDPRNDLGSITQMTKEDIYSVKQPTDFCDLCLSKGYAKWAFTESGAHNKYTPSLETIPERLKYRLIQLDRCFPIRLRNALRSFIPYKVRQIKHNILYSSKEGRTE